MPGQVVLQCGQASRGSPLLDQISRTLFSGAQIY